MLSDNANGTVVADAMLVQPVATPTVDLNWTGGSLTGPTISGGGIFVHPEPDLHHQRGHGAKLLRDFLLRLDELDVRRQCRSIGIGNNLRGL